MTLLLLLIEFFDELAYGIDGAALPALRADINLNYAQIGLLLGIPKIISTFIEPVLLLAGDTRHRKTIITAGGLFISLAFLLVASAQGFIALLAAFIIMFPASGAFVSLSQATLMDLNPNRETHSMARWTLAGSIGNLVGPLILAGGFSLGWGWRWSYLGLAILGICLVCAAWIKLPAHRGAISPTPANSMRDLAENVRVALRTPSLLRWYALLETSDLLMDVFFSYAALYFADRVGLSVAQTGLVLAALTGTSFLTDLLLIPLLERFSGRWLVHRLSACALLVYPALLLAPCPAAKVILAIAVRFLTMGWYAVLQGEAYASMPGRSGTVSALSSLAGLGGGVLLWLIGWTAEQASLQTAMWMLLLAPISLVIWLPRAEKQHEIQPE